MPPEAAGLAATRFLYEKRVKPVAGCWQAEHERFILKGQIARLPEHRAAHLATVAGTCGKRYLQRQQLFECGEATVAVLTEIVHRCPCGWYPDVGRLHDLLQMAGPEKIELAGKAATAAACFSGAFIEQCLGRQDRRLSASA